LILQFLKRERKRFCTIRSKALLRSVTQHTLINGHQTLRNGQERSTVGNFNAAYDQRSESFVKSRSHSHFKIERSTVKDKNMS
jgi:hypothetical protein